MHEQHRDTYEAIVLMVVDGSGGGGAAGAGVDTVSGAWEGTGTGGPA